VFDPPVVTDEDRGSALALPVDLSSMNPRRPGAKAEEKPRGRSAVKEAPAPKASAEKPSGPELVNKYEMARKEVSTER